MALAEVRDNLGRLWTMGGDGLAMLLLSNLVILVTGGISLALTLARVWRVARRTLALTTFEGVRLVPGVFLKDGRPNADFVKRLERAQGLSGEGAIVLLGGQTAASGPSEAAAARDWLVARGLAADRIRLETGSRNTLENLWAARGHFLDAGGRAVVITNRYHLARAGALADGLAIDHELCAAEEVFRPSLADLPKLLWEAYTLHWYHVGRWYARRTANRGMLQRIE